MQSGFLRQLLFQAIGIACAACSSPAAIAPAPESAPASNRWADPARQVLLPHCGRCHNGALETSLPRARAVYDLSESAWYARIAPHQYDRMLQRVRAVEAILEADKSVVERFVRCARDNDCTE